MVHSCVDTKMATIPPAGKERGKETKKDNVLVCIFKNSSTSIGSTSCAMATSTALFCSMSLVMLCMPYFTAMIFFTAGSWPPFALVLARLRNLSRFWAFDSGRYLWKNLNSCVTRERERGRESQACTHQHHLTYQSASPVYMWTGWWWAGPSVAGRGYVVDAVCERSEAISQIESNHA